MELVEEVDLLIFLVLTDRLTSQILRSHIPLQPPDLLDFPYILKSLDILDLQDLADHLDLLKLEDLQRTSKPPKAFGIPGSTRSCGYSKSPGPPRPFEPPGYQRIFVLSLKLPNHRNLYRALD